MPTYDYVCQDCGHRFERFQTMTEASLEECPKCHAKALQRLIGAGAGLLFKGSGFYLTDYKKSGSSPAKQASESAPSSASESTPPSAPAASAPASAKPTDS
ncbi:MAG: zinc ribbon domain-containing protein [Ignavibacteria bacterium]|nr:zinc ribbon domain-containing protein [Ignavibacteria bacterium]